jgi:diguanylate cyclase (GGDEF)-like protein
VSGRTRVAVVVDRVHNYHVAVTRGVESVLEAAGVALLVVISQPLHPRHDTMIRRLVRAGELHGIVITAMQDVSMHLLRISAGEGLPEGIPSASLNLVLPGVPVVLSANAEGIRLAMDHLIDDCGRTRPVLFAGNIENDDSCEREAAFRAEASARNLTLPRISVVHADFLRETAYHGLIELLEAGRDFDSVLASNDEMAMGVLDALQEHGIRIPDDVAVVGFDNSAEAYRTKPPLTSVEIGLHQQGRLAALAVLAQLADQQVPAQVRSTASLLVRQSSSSQSWRDLPDFARNHDLAPAPDNTELFGPVLQERLCRLRTEWLAGMNRRTLTAERAEALETELSDLVGAHPEPLWWGGVTAGLWAGLAAAVPGGEQLSPVAEAGLLRVKLRIDRAVATVREERDREELELSEHLLGFNRVLTRCQSLSELTREVSAYLPRLNIRRCFLVLLEEHAERQTDTDTEAAGADFPTAEPGQARVVMTYRDGDFNGAPDPELFGIEHLLPPSLAEELEHGTLTVQPLYTTHRWFGIMLHEQTTMDRHTGEAIRLDTSRVLDTIARAKDLTRRASELEALVSMRSDQLKQEVITRKAAQDSLYEANLGLREALLVDGLTGLQNRTSFDEYLTRAWHQHERRREPLSVLMVDVDHFKLYNDTYGHLAGDACLCKVATCMRAATLRRQDMVARYGGEEFAFILSDTGLEGARLVAGRLLKNLAEAAIAHSGSSQPSRQVSVSIGVGSTELQGADSVQALLELADQAMYTAKHNGRNRVEG